MASICRWNLRTYECGADGCATLPALLDLMQESASLNAAELGFSKTDFEARGENASWVLTRMKTRIMRYPRWGEEIALATWPRGGRKITAYRDFEAVSAATGERFAIATSEWMMLDLAARKVLRIPDAVFAAADTGRGCVFGEEGFAHLKWEGGRAALQCGREGTGAAAFRAGRSQIDLNGHVNNVHYVRWMLDATPEAFAATREIAECEVVFKSETFAGEDVVAEVAAIGEGEMLHRVRTADGASDHALARTVWRAKT